MLEQGDLTSVPVEWDKSDYLDPEKLDAELRRQYDVCSSCRLCFNLCPAFPNLFKHFDSDEVDHDPSKLSRAQVGEFVDLCYNCKLCFIKCPYTPPHKFLIDIPKVVMRARAVEADSQGVDLREQMLASPDKVGRLATIARPVASFLNWANGNRLSRIVLEKIAGIHRDKILPRFSGVTFENWFRRYRTRAKSELATALPAPDKHRVVLFHTCIVNYNQPEIGRAAVGIFDKHGIEVQDPEGQTCCGMPYLDSGRIEDAIQHFRTNINALLPYARKGYAIVVPEPTCGMMLKKEYADYLQDGEREMALEVASRVYDLSEYLVKLASQGELKKDFPVNVGIVAYHQPCHLKYQAIGQKSVELLRFAGATVTVIDKGCSGHDGTWAMKTEHFELAQKVAKGLHRGVKDARADIVATDCSLAGIQITQGTGIETIHPVEVLAKAYGLDTD